MRREVSFCFTCSTYILETLPRFCTFETVVPLLLGLGKKGLCLSLPSVDCFLVLLCKCKCVCLTADLLSSRPIHWSAAHSPSTHPEAVWVSEQEWALVVFSCVTLCATPPGYYSFDKRGPWKVHASFGVHMQSSSGLLAYLSFAGPGDDSHICVNRGAFRG